MKKHHLILGILLILFLISRLYQITSNPPSVYWDEASIAYNAYSVNFDGKDEWGEFLPVHFRAFGEFKLPVYVYSVAVFVRIFGMNEFSVRIPAVLYSLGSLIVVYKITEKLLGKTIPALF